MDQQQSLLVSVWVDRSLHSLGQQRSLPALEQVWDLWRGCSKIEENIIRMDEGELITCL